MFGKSENTSGFTSDVVLGERYRDDQTGIEGTATAIIFFQYGCERVDIEVVVNGEIKNYSFDAPRLKHIETGAQVASDKTGGPDRASESLRSRR